MSAGTLWGGWRGPWGRRRPRPSTPQASRAWSTSCGARAAGPSPCATPTSWRCRTRACSTRAPPWLSTGSAPRRSSRRSRPPRQRTGARWRWRGCCTTARRARRSRRARWPAWRTGTTPGAWASTARLGSTSSCPRPWTPSSTTTCCTPSGSSSRARRAPSGCASRPRWTRRGRWSWRPAGRRYRSPSTPSAASCCGDRSRLR
mmetsp:Transcript_25194/g.86275  ORF Transcript_25194/g.86275 Transcript_25194/m.86275 type:complete len:203 (+) Transcript_25194:981-1589(+)